MQVNTSTHQALNISRSPTDIQFNVIRNNWTYATITGKVTSGGVTFYSWTAMLPGATGGLNLAPEMGGGSISPLADPAVQYNEAAALITGSVVLMRRRCGHATYGSIWEVVFTKPKDKSTSGIEPAENEPQLCYLSGTMYAPPVYVGAGPNFSPSRQNVPGGGYYMNHQYWWLPRVSGPYGWYYLETDPWGVSFGFTQGTIAPPDIFSLPCIVKNAIPNAVKPPWGVYVGYTGSPNWWYTYGANPSVYDYQASLRTFVYPSSVVTPLSKVTLVSSDYIARPNIGQFIYYRDYNYLLVPELYDISSVLVKVNGNASGVWVYDPMRLTERGEGPFERKATGAVLSVSTRRELPLTPQADPLENSIAYPSWVPLHNPYFTRFVLTQLGPNPDRPTVGVIA